MDLSARLHRHGPFEIGRIRYPLSTAVYCERTSGEILLLRRTRGSSFPGMWFLPGGLVENGESPSEGASREVFEESSLIPIQPLRMVGCYLMPMYGDIFLQLTFSCRVAACDVRVSSEHDDYQWVTPEKMLRQFTPAAIRERASGDPDAALLLERVRADLLIYLEQRGIAVIEQED